jgi:hypothetical protein
VAPAERRRFTPPDASAPLSARRRAEAACGNKQTRNPHCVNISDASTDIKLGATDLPCDMTTLLDTSIQATDGVVGEVKDLYFDESENCALMKTGLIHRRAYIEIELADS